MKGLKQTNNPAKAANPPPTATGSSIPKDTSTNDMKEKATKAEAAESVFKMAQNDPEHLQNLQQAAKDFLRKDWENKLDKFFIKEDNTSLANDFPFYKKYLIESAGLDTEKSFIKAVTDENLRELLDQMGVRFGHLPYFLEFWNEMKKTLKPAVPVAKEIPRTPMPSVDDYSKSISSPTPKRLQEGVKAIYQLLSSTIVGHETNIRLALLALLSGNHLLLLGEPGTAKSALANNLFQILQLSTTNHINFHSNHSTLTKENIQDLRSQLTSSTSNLLFFRFLMTKMTLPDELFGPVSLSAMERDEYIRLIQGYLPSATVAFLDEIFKANSAILNALLTILNERIYDNGRQTIKLPLLSVIGASNEYPGNVSLEALYDRFLFRVWVEPISESNEFMKMISVGLNNKNHQNKISCSSIQQQESLLHVYEIRALQQKIFPPNMLTKDHLSCLSELNHALRHPNDIGIESSGPIIVSNRRFVEISRVIQVSAFIHGRENLVSFIDFLFIPHVLWQHHEQREMIELIFENVFMKHVLQQPLSQLKIYQDELKNYLFESESVRMKWIVKLNK